MIQSIVKRDKELYNAKFKKSHPVVTRRHGIGMVNLTGTLTHLSAFAPETTHPLLAPFGTHASSNLKGHGEGLFVKNAVSGEGSSGENTGSIYKTDETGGDELLVLDLGLEGDDGSVGIHVVCGGSDSVGGNENLHLSLVVFIFQVALNLN